MVLFWVEVWDNAGGSSRGTHSTVGHLSTILVNYAPTSLALVKYAPIVLRIAHIMLAYDITHQKVTVYEMCLYT